MAQPMVLVFHPDRTVTAPLAAVAATTGAWTRAVSEATLALSEIRRLGPDVVLLPFRGGGERSPALIELTRERLPACRIIALVAPEDEEEARAIKDVFGTIRIEPEIEVERTVGTLRDAIAAFTPAGTILVVEDAEVNLEMVADILHARSYRVLRAASAEEGLAIVASASPDMVLMDIYLPGQNGIDAVRTLKASPRSQAIPIVMLSANGTDQAITEALDAGAIDFIVKPFSPRRLLEKVALVLSKRELLAHA